MTVDDVFAEAHDTYKISESKNEHISLETLESYLDRLHQLDCYGADEDMAECLHV